MPSSLAPLSAYAPFALVALAVALGATPLAGTLARRLGIMDHPDQLLKPHARPTPYLGGLAIALAWMAAASLALLLPPGVAGLPTRHLAAVMLPILGGGLAMVLLGMLDDAGDLLPRIRLAISGLVVVLMILGTGAGLHLPQAIAAVLGTGGWPAWLGPAVALPLGVFIVLGACNSSNLIDGLDGLCAGVAGVMGVAYALLAALALAGDGAAEAPASYIGRLETLAVLPLALGLAGAAFGFLYHNFNPARIFMGDAGSLLIGYVCGACILLLAQTGELRWVVGSVIVFGLPIFDTALALYRRWRSRKPIFAGDRSHFYDQLVQRGFSVRATALICYAVAALYGALGLAVVWMSAAGAAAYFLAIVAASAAAAAGLGFTRPERRRRMI